MANSPSLRALGKAEYKRGFRKTARELIDILISFLLQNNFFFLKPVIKVQQLIDIYATVLSFKL